MDLNRRVLAKSRLAAVASHSLLGTLFARQAAVTVTRLSPGIHQPNERPFNR